MRKKLVVCIGAALVDESFKSLNKTVAGTSNPSIYFRSSGGVACNIANHLSLLGKNVELISHFGNDTDGKWLMENCLANGVGISHSLINNKDTGRYAAVLTPNGELFVGAMSGHFESEISLNYLKEKISLLKTASLLQIDCNLNAECLKWLIDFSEKEKIPCIIEPVSIPKAARLKNIFIQNILLITPNFEEMVAMNDEQIEINKSELIQKLISLGVKNLWVRNGVKGSQIYTIDSIYELSAPQVNVIDTTGAGDAALAGWIYAWLEEKSPAECLLYGHSMASIILTVKGAVNKNLSSELLEKTVKNYI